MQMPKIEKTRVRREIERDGECVAAFDFTLPRVSDGESRADSRMNGFYDKFASALVFYAEGEFADAAAREYAEIPDRRGRIIYKKPVFAVDFTCSGEESGRFELSFLAVCRRGAKKQKEVRFTHKWDAERGILLKKPTKNREKKRIKGEKETKIH